MIISFLPQRRDGELSASIVGDILTINGESFDFTDLPEGGTLPAGHVPSEWISGPVERIAGSVRLSLINPHGPNPSGAVAFPTPLIDPHNGPLDIPVDAKDMPDVEG